MYRCVYIYSDEDSPRIHVHARAFRFLRSRDAADELYLGVFGNAV